MKAFWISLYLICFSFVCASPSPSNIEQVELSTTILTIDKNSPSKNKIIHDLLALQSSLIVSSQKPIAEEFVNTGFLLVPMTQEYVFDLLELKSGQIVCAFLDKTLIGYILLTDISEFKELYQDENAGRFETSIDLPTLEAWLANPFVGYIEQIAVKPGYSRKGIGSELIAACKILKPQGLIADVFIYPVKNEPSLSFFLSGLSAIWHSLPISYSKCKFSLSAPHSSFFLESSVI